MKNFFIYNPVAGSGKKIEQFKKNIELLIAKKDYDITLIETKCAKDATKIANKLCTDYASEEITIFACGGDGTMNEVVNGIVHHSNVRFGIVPIGSCNDFLKNFKEYDFLDIEKQLNGTCVLLDAIKTNDLYGINVTNIGFDARVNYDQILLRPKCKNVKQAYNLAILKNLIKNRGRKMTIKCDDQLLFQGTNLLLAIGNGGYYGGGYHCAPKAILDDGFLDVVSIKNVMIPIVAVLIKKFKAGKHLEKKSRIFNYKLAKHVEVNTEEVACVCIDGETIHSKHIEIDVLEKQIKFILPKK